MEVAFIGSDFLTLLKKVCVKILEIFQLLRFYVKSIGGDFSASTVKLILSTVEKSEKPK